MSLYNFTNYDGLRPEDIAQYSTQRFLDLIQNSQMIGERALPWVSVDDWTTSVGRVSFRNVANAVIGPDSVLPRGPLGRSESKEYQILKTGMKQGLIESEIKKLRELFRPGAGRLAPVTLLNSRPYQFAAGLVQGYRERAENMRMEGLVNGEYEIPGTGKKVVWDIPAGHKVALTGTDAWTPANNATADGLGDILAFDEVLYDELGVHSDYTVMSKAALDRLLAQDATKTRIYAYSGSLAQQQTAANGGNLGVFGPVELSAVNAYLASRECGPIVLYDRKYQEFDFRGNTQPQLKRFLPENGFYMIAGTALDGVYGPGVSGSTATGYFADGPVVENDFQSGIYVWLTEHDEPYEVQVKSVAWGLPVIGDGRTLVQGTLWGN